MSDERTSGAFRRWVRATWLGWLAGIPLIIVLALALEAVGVGGSQLAVGLSMGIGVGFMQARVMRAVLLDELAPWFWASVVGLSVPFLAVDLARLAGRDVPYMLYVAVACAGLVAGVLQAFVLRRRVRRPALWIPTSVIGWTLASALAALADRLPRSMPLRGIAGALVFLGIVAGGGLVLGLVTGLVFQRYAAERRALD